MKIAISGAGIAGLALAIALERRGFAPQVFEAAPSLRPIGAGLGLAENALRALWQIGLRDKIVQAAEPLHRFTVTDTSGATLTVSDTVGQSVCIHRGVLQSLLLDGLGEGTVVMGKKAVRLEQKGSGVRILFEDGSGHDADCLIVADGSRSSLRQMVAPHSRIRYAGYTCWRAVVQVPHDLEGGAVEVWGSSGRFGYVPLPDSFVYWFACVNAPEGRVLQHFEISDLCGVFKDYPKIVLEILRSTPTDRLIYDDIADIAPLERYTYGNVLLVGDAAHASTPNMGQGAGMALEDAIVLADCIASYGTLDAAFDCFERMRIGRTHGIIRQSNRIGRIAQLENKYLIFFRNTVLKLLPGSFHRKQQQEIADYEFKPLATARKL